MALANFAVLCRDNRIAALQIISPAGFTRAVCPLAGSATGVVVARAPISGGGQLRLSVRPEVDLQRTQDDIARYMNEYNQLAAQKRNIRTLYLLFLLAIALFILFVATWIALLLSRQIISPISALLVAAGAKCAAAISAIG